VTGLLGDLPTEDNLTDYTSDELSDLGELSDYDVNSHSNHSTRSKGSLSGGSGREMDGSRHSREKGVRGQKVRSWLNLPEPSRIGAESLLPAIPYPRHVLVYVPTKRARLRAHPALSSHAQSGGSQYGVLERGCVLGWGAGEVTVVGLRCCVRGSD